jgi:hypothetical protein
MTFRFPRVEENEGIGDSRSNKTPIRTHPYNYHSAIMATFRWTQSADRLPDTRTDRMVVKGRRASNFAVFFFFNLRQSYTRQWRKPDASTLRSSPYTVQMAVAINIMDQKYLDSPRERNRSAVSRQLICRILAPSCHEDERLRVFEEI